MSIAAPVVTKRRVKAGRRGVARRGQGRPVILAQEAPNREAEGRNINGLPLRQLAL